MRLWHYKLIPYLPDKQLLGQWRELNSIFRKQNKHILINYIYEYDKLDLFHYTKIVIEEMKKRNFKINKKSKENAENYFKDVKFIYGKDGFNGIPFKKHHNNSYLVICFLNLYEKKIRGQKDYSEELFDKLWKFIIKEIGVDLWDYL